MRTYDRCISRVATCEAYEYESLSDAQLAETKVASQLSVTFRFQIIVRCKHDDVVEPALKLTQKSGGRHKMNYIHISLFTQTETAL